MSALIYLAVFGAGCVGGFALDLIQGKGGLRMPGCFESTEEDKVRHYFDMGFIADLLIGGVAALAVYGIDHDALEETWQLLAVSLVAGVAGGGLLLSFAKTLMAAEEKAVSALLESSLNDIANGKSGNAPGSGAAEELRKQAKERLASLKILRNRLRRI